jgi:hypothetical protein
VASSSTAMMSSDGAPRAKEISFWSAAMASQDNGKGRRAAT